MLQKHVRMPIASLVVTLDNRESLRHVALSCLVSDARVALGTACGEYLPVVLDTTTAEEGAALLESWLAVPGVLQVDVVGIDFSTEEQS